jgi:hypothetical protein
LRHFRHGYGTITTTSLGRVLTLDGLLQRWGRTVGRILEELHLAASQS